MELGVAFGFTLEPSTMFYEAGLEPSFTTFDEVAYEASFEPSSKPVRVGFNSKFNEDWPQHQLGTLRLSVRYTWPRLRVR